jgi:hypothetical protein
VIVSPISNRRAWEAIDRSLQLLAFSAGALPGSVFMWNAGQADALAPPERIAVPVTNIPSPILVRTVRMIPRGSAGALAAARAPEAPAATRNFFFSSDMGFKRP